MLVWPDVAYRVDIGSLRPAHRLDDGRLRVDGQITRTGVFTYRNPDGSERREYRPPSEVFDAASLATFAFAPVTDDHPVEMVSAKNARHLTVGQVGEAVRRSDNWIVAPLVVNDEETIAKMESGKVQLSCGYHADIDETPGVSPEGEKYDSIQRNIRGNHVAIVDAARAGSEARVRLDAGFMITTGKQAAPRFDTMDFKKLYEESIAQAAAEKARADKAEADLAVAQAESAKESARADGLSKELDAEKTARAAELASMPEKVAARVALEGKARSVLGEKFDAAGKSDRELMTAVIKDVDDEELGADMHDVYVEGRFDSAIKRGGSAHLDSLRVLVPTDAKPPARNDDDEYDEDAARRRMEARSDAAWKATLSEQGEE